MFAARNMLFASSAAALSYRSTVLADNPVAYWRLGESSGTTAADEMGFYNGTYVGSPTLGVTGAVAGNTAVTLNGSNQKVTAGTTLPTLDNATKTIEAWVYRISTKLQGVVDKDYDTMPTGYGGWGLWITSSNQMSFWATPLKDIVDTGAIVPANQWAHIACVWNNATKTARFYLNGVLNSEVTNSSVDERSSGSAPLLIGALRSSLSPYFFYGSIDEVALYNTALSPERIAAHYAAATS